MKYYIAIPVLTISGLVMEYTGFGFGAGICAFIVVYLMVKLTKQIEKDADEIS